MICVLRPWHIPVMHNTISTLIIALQSATAGAPEWMHVIPAGRFTGVDGRGPYFLNDAAAVVANFASEGRKLPIDENHSTDLAGKKGFAAPARGWIVDLQSREDGIWAKVEWTPEGLSLMQGKAYGYVSPVLQHPPKPPYNIARLLRVALTNDPNLTLTSLHSNSQENSMDIVALRKALGLPETADETAVLAAITASHSASTSQAALMSRVAQAVGVDATADGEALVTALNAKLKPVTTVEAENSELKAQVTSLNSRVETLVTTHAMEKATTTIDAAIAAGKVVPALRDHMIARHSKNPTEVETELKLAPSINAGGLGNRQPPVTGETATEEELKVASMMGVDPEAFKKQHATLHAKGA